MDFGEVTAAAFAGLATGVGVIVWAPILNFIIQTFKSVPQIKPIFDAREKLWAFILAGVFVVLAFIVGTTLVPPSATLDVFGVLLAFLSWLALARLTMSTYDDLSARTVDGKRPPESVLNTAHWTGTKGTTP